MKNLILAPIVTTFLISPVSFSKDNYDILNKVYDAYITSDLSEEEKAKRILVLELSPYVKTLNRNILTYNYRKKELVGIKDTEIVDPDSDKGVKYANEWSQSIKKYLPDESGYFGWGLYSASNITTSSGYGFDETNFSLLTIEYKKGEKLLDVRKKRSNIPLTKRSYEYFSKKCKKMDSSTYLENSIPKIQFTKDKFCHDALVSALEYLDVDGVVHEWYSGRSSYCEFEPGTSFVTFNKVLDRDSLDLYSNLIPKEDRGDLVMKPHKSGGEKGEGKRIRKYKRYIKKAKTDEEKFKVFLDTYAEKKIPEKTRIKFKKIAVNASMFHSPLFTETNYKFFYPSDEAERNKMIEEVKKETFGCSKAYEKEDAPHYDPGLIYNYLLKDSGDGLSPKLKDMIKAELEQRR